MKMLLAIAACLALCGCNTTRFSRTETYEAEREGKRVTVTNTVQVVNVRAIWSTESYTARLSKDTASLTASKSSPDAETIAAIVQAVIAAKP